ncbi:hypothetical protein [Kangiella sp. HZ709]|uniref:hypothetical protein n=1 Tax=Kangiella sp. HZ709 TaxID=2666328 RepID=UPI0012B047E1|nr:hypothetical protein [Kangiella sp. HZ709]MRX28735.1 hypothetical protein [Kangiella sp. HZ709]
MSVSILDLWLAILLAGFFCWIVSALIHMFIKYHNADYKKLANEDAVSDVIRQGSPAPGLYHLPHCNDMNEMAKPEMQERFKKGPIAMISVFPNGLPPMGKLLMQQLLFFIFSSMLIGYVASLAFPVGADYMQVFRLVMAVAFIAYGVGNIPYSVWYGHPWSNCMRFLIDAAIYASVTAGTFAWLWPQA